jgi:hypothetical protein
MNVLIGMAIAIIALSWLAVIFNVIYCNRVFRAMKEKSDMQYYNYCENLRTIRDELFLAHKRIIALDNAMNKFIRQNKVQKSKELNWRKHA